MEEKDFLLAFHIFLGALAVVLLVDDVVQK